jgi:hypothetical protein
MKKLFLFLFLVSCSTVQVKDKYLIRQFNDEGDLVKETLTSSYSVDKEVLTIYVDGKKVKVVDNFEIRQLR